MNYLLLLHIFQTTGVNARFVQYVCHVLDCSWKNEI